MSDHTLYKPAPTVHPSARRKAEQLKRLMTAAEEVYQQTVEKLEAARAGTTPALDAATREAQRTAVAREMAAGRTLGLQDLIAQLTAQLDAAKKKLVEAAFEEADRSQQAEAAETNRHNTQARIPASIAPLRAEAVEREKIVAKARYRLEQHLARHPGADQSEPEEAPEPPTPEDDVP